MLSELTDLDLLAALLATAIVLVRLTTLVTSNLVSVNVAIKEYLDVNVINVSPDFGHSRLVRLVRYILCI